MNSYVDATPMGSLYKQLGKKVKAARAKISFTPEELADKAGLHRTCVAGMETGCGSTPIKNLEKIAQVLGVRTNGLR